MANDGKSNIKCGAAPLECVTKQTLVPFIKLKDIISSATATEYNALHMIKVSESRNKIRVVVDDIAAHCTLTKYYRNRKITQK